MTRIRRSVTFNVVSQAAPAWWNSLAEDTWTTIATASPRRLVDVIQSPGSSRPPGGWGFENAILGAFTGAAVDQTRGEYLIVAGGGHGDGANNSAYALSLRSATPAWRRLTDATPDANLGNLNLESDGKFADGRPRAMHATNVCWVGGTGIKSRVVFPVMSSVTSGQGGHADWLLSFDRDVLGAGATPLPWTAANLGPWAFVKRTNGNSNWYGFGTAVYDPVTQKLFGISNGSGSFGIYWSITPVTANDFGAITTQIDSSRWIAPGWATVAPDLGIVIVGNTAANNIQILNIATNTWATANQAGQGVWPGSTAYGGIYGCVYMPETKEIIVANPFETGNTMYVASIPLTSGGAYDPTGLWVWSQRVRTGGPTGAPSGWGSSKWNRVNDMGDGRPAIVFVSDVNGATYVYKPPIKKRYSTTFPLTEAAISEGNRWQNMVAPWTPVRSANGRAFSSTFQANYEDSIALGKGYAADHGVRMKLYVRAGTVTTAGAGTTSHEVECHLRGQISGNVYKGYECLLGYSNAGTYCQLFRHDGVYASWFDPNVLINPGNISQGDEFDCFIVGRTITARIIRANGTIVPMFTYTDNSAGAHLTGQPGIAFFCRGDQVDDLAADEVLLYNA